MSRPKKRKTATAARPLSLLNETRPTKKMEGMRTRLSGICAVIDPDTDEIIRTYDPETQELLLDFPTGAIPEFPREFADVYSSRDFTMEFDHDGSPTSVSVCAEKLVAHAVVRASAGLPCSDLVLGDTVGSCAGTGRYLSSEHSILMVLAGVAWSARNGVMPTVSELAIPLRILSETIYTDTLQPYEVIPVSETLKWRMSETVQVLNRYSKLIRMIGRSLSCSRFISAKELELFLGNKSPLAGYAPGSSSEPDGFQQSCA